MVTEKNVVGIVNMMIVFKCLVKQNGKISYIYFYNWINLGSDETFSKLIETTNFVISNVNSTT